MSDDDLNVYSDDPPDPRAVHRTIQRVDETWETVKPIHDMKLGGGSLVKILGFCAVIGAAIAWAAKQGFIPS